LENLELLHPGNKASRQEKPTFMNTKLFVDNLAAATTYSQLMDLFSVYGNVVEVNLPLDRTNGRRRGFAFVTMATVKGARAALEALNGKEIESLALRISEAQQNEVRAALAVDSRGARRTFSSRY
jgi:cold-inducible RNA-binding protein